ncbi:MAG TPA: hypothetical protein VGI66_05580 [Streptosporangiaceae bacterium]
MILAAINPDNTAAGYNWTFAYPMLLFIIIAGVLWYLFGRPHRRVPNRPISATAGSRQPDSGTARAAAVAGGLSVAPGAGTKESEVEPGGAHLAASLDDGGTGDGGTATGESATGDSASGDSEAQE